MKNLIKNKNVLCLILLFLFLTACNYNQEEKEKTFQVKYSPENKAAVRDSMKALIESEKKMYKKTDSIGKHIIYDLKIKEIDTSYVKKRIKTIRSQAEYLRVNDIPGVPDGKNKDAILKALQSHDDSLVNFYKNFHGYRVKYNTYLSFIESVKSKNYHFREILWVDTIANIIHESYADGIPMVIGDSVYSPKYTSKNLVKKWWPDTLSTHIDTVFLDKEFRQNAKIVD